MLVVETSDDTQCVVVNTIPESYFQTRGDMMTEEMKNLKAHYDDGVVAGKKMNRTLVNQLAQLFVFGVRAIVASNTTNITNLGTPKDHLRPVQEQLDEILDEEV